MRKLATLALLFIAFQVSAAKLPMLTAEGNDGKVALAVEAVKVDVLIRGHLARTTYELTYRNDLDRDIDGQFQFPLPPDAEVSELGLYFDGKLRRAVAVERVAAKAAYERTIQRRVDPALAEWSATRAFRFRVYPIPAKGTKVVHIAYDQELTSGPYVLDLRYGTTLASVDLRVDSDVPVESDGFRLSQWNGGWTLQERQMKLDGVIRATRREQPAPALMAWSAEDKSWYYSAAAHIRTHTGGMTPASQVLLLYDVSSSAVQRDEVKLRAFLNAFLAKQRGGVRVSVVPFHVTADAAIETTAAGLDTTLNALPFAGATNLAGLIERIASAPDDTRVVVVTDGMNTLGGSGRVAAALEKLRRRITVVNASSSADDGTLARMAGQHGGWHLDLTRVEPTEAAETAMQAATLVPFRSAHPAVRGVLPAETSVTGQAWTTINARSAVRQYSLPLVIGNLRQDLEIREVDSEAERDMVRRAWARARLRELLDRNTSNAAVIEHGRRFRQLTPQTSLIVLDTWQDYELHGFPLPEDLKEERERARKALEQARRERERLERTQKQVWLARSGAIPAPSGRVAWFVRGIIMIDGSSLPGVTVTMSVPNQPDTETTTDEQGRFWLTARRAPASFTLRAELPGFQTIHRSYPEGVAKGALIELEMRIAAITESITVTAEAPTLDVTATAVASNVSLVRPSPGALADALLAQLAGGQAIALEELDEASIEERMNRITAVVEKLRTMRSIDERFRYYVAARSVVGGEKLLQAESALAMFADAPELAVRALTDLAEAYPDDAATLRLLGRVLDGWGRGELARLMFERALELSPDEEQTKHELKLLDAREKERRDARVFEASELQVEVMWDSNFTDVDLHVIEPSGEEVSYQHTKSALGGALHEDVTSGFGPETYTIPSMDRGEYEIALQYYSDDDSQVGSHTLVHVIVYVRGERRDLFIPLVKQDARVVVARVKD